MGMSKETRLTLAITLSFCFMLVEVAGGLYANSLSILADAAHLFSDVTGFVIALIAVILSKHPPSSTFTYGMARAEVMGAFCSVITLWTVTIYLVYTAVLRIDLWMKGEAEPVNGKLMFIIACFGILVNVCLALVFHEDSSSLTACSHAHGDGGHDHSHGHGGGHEEHSDHNDIKPNSSSSSSSGTHDHGHDHHHSNEQTALIKHDEKSHTYGGVEIEHGHSHDHHHGEADSHTNTSASGGHMDHSHDHNHSSTDDCTHDHDHDHGSLSHEHSTDPLSPISHTTPAGDVNLQAAHMHVIADLIQSAGVALAGAAIWYNPEWQIIDPISTFLFSFLVVWATFALMYRILSIFMEGTPAHVSQFVNMSISLVCIYRNII